MASRVEVEGTFERTEGHSQSAGDFPRSISEKKKAMAAPVPISKEAANVIEILAKMVHRIRIILMSYIGTAVSGRQRLLVRKKKKVKLI